MSNLRIVRDNLAKTAATIAASSEAGSLVVENLQDDRKSVIWRSTANTGQTLTLTWSTDQFIDCVVIPFANLSSTATMQVLLYSTGDVLEYDSGAVLCSENVNLDVFNWGSEPLGVNAYSVGAYSYGRVYCDATTYDNGNIVKCVINIEDGDNTNAYVEAGGLVIGQYYEFHYGGSYGSSSSPMNTDKVNRTQSGDLIITEGIVSRKLNVKLDWLNATDRDSVYNLLTTATSPMFISLLAESSDTTLEQQNQIYGRIANSGYSHNFYSNYTSNLVIEEI